MYSPEADDRPLVEKAAARVVVKEVVVTEAVVTEAATEAAVWVVGMEVVGKVEGWAEVATAVVMVGAVKAEGWAAVVQR